MRLNRPTIALLAAAMLVVGVSACADNSSSREAAAPTGERGPGHQAERADSSDNPPGRADPGSHPSDDPIGRVVPGHDAVQVTSPAGETAELTDGEIAGLLWMREEEQLAHDVYVVLGEQWGLRIFENIAASERSHIDGVAELLGRYEIDDPMSGQATGRFTIPEMQELHDRLVADGSESLIAALEVGAFIEELDIVDLRARAAATEVDEIVALYARLERGSRNHLRAFTSQLERRDAGYVPTQLDQSAFEEIISSEMERGHGA